MSCPAVSPALFTQPSSGQDPAATLCLAAAPGEGQSGSIPEKEPALLLGQGSKGQEEQEKTGHVIPEKHCCSKKLNDTCPSLAKAANSEQPWAVAQTQTHSAVLSLLGQEGATVHELLSVPQRHG